MLLLCSATLLATTTDLFSNWFLLKARTVHTLLLQHQSPVTNKDFELVNFSKANLSQGLNSDYRHYLPLQPPLWSSRKVIENDLLLLQKLIIFFFFHKNLMFEILLCFLQNHILKQLNASKSQQGSLIEFVIFECYFAMYFERRFILVFGFLVLV
eukprot:TRINITY_DN12768_c1_g1_i1.p1 TRINITY_DN12768_c1_g1~~TRINITY_DN12768_c1_g1_i1.p1  ORF type:complete len:155 (-),score=0.23 TRINITY_DN12768_c1_g1_i1:737-1201(-)